MKAYFQMLAHYNRWANRLLLQACSSLPDHAYHHDLGAYFGSIHGTLNHLYVADAIWLHRLSGEGESPYSLEEQPFDLLADLSAARAILDERLIALIDMMDEDEIHNSILYRTIRKPLVMEQPVSSALAHVFNHQAHHRGQVHSFLTQLRYKPPALDLIYFQRETGIGMTEEPPAAAEVIKLGEKGKDFR